MVTVPGKQLPSVELNLRYPPLRGWAFLRACRIGSAEHRNRTLPSKIGPSSSDAMMDELELSTGGLTALHLRLGLRFESQPARPARSLSFGAIMTFLFQHPARIALLVFAVMALIVLAFAAALHNWHRVGALYRRCFSRSRRERQFIAVAAFYLSFALVRFVAHAVRSGVAPFHDLAIAGRHIHHLVFGILILLAVGYGWLLEFGSQIHVNSRVSGRIMALFYGIGAALTLDEFALWLNLEDVYWAEEGRASVDAVLLFGAFMIVGLLGGRFLRLLASEALRPFTALRR